ncbi:putative tetR family transcriptional regulator [Nostocoides japonicum T1-X7]|uniref:Putative tetR family transcriptional regulator n=1 Tax=Nostocoides japonicum T1-X7 TaxID=1194083 RepID=A0A077M7V9_9MICO|nr:TetR/AcrR family transcriptional regulator [Tetrasphaera japonica]CCH80135.1 putative tetR family transcriptional regulator [Tetrasphaera japonica T1-X7]
MSTRAARDASDEVTVEPRPGRPDPDRGPCGTAPDKPLRADAARNRARLLDAAIAAFTDHGVDVPLEDVAKAAGVGIGTLYRHFPTRCDLVLAAYSSQVDAVEQRSIDLSQQLPPEEALHEWMRGFVDFYAVKMGMVNLLRQMMQGNPETFERTRARLLASAERVLTPAMEAGLVRSDATPQELVRALGGICLAATTPDGQETSRAVVDLVYDGLRYGAPATAGSPVNSPSVAPA